MYKKILLPIIFLFSFYTANSQVYVTPLVGYGYWEMKNYENVDKLYWHVNNDRFTDNNFLFGLKFNQIINNRWSFNLGSTYSKNKIHIHNEAVDCEIIPSHLLFSNWNFIPSLNYNIIGGLYAGVGFNYGIMWIKPNGVFESGFYNHQYGVNFNINYNIKNIDINLNLNGGLGFIKKNLDFIKSLKPINNINLMIGYRFKALNTWKRTKGVNCPTI